MTIGHPLDPLTIPEITRTVQIARSLLALPETARFANIELQESDQAAGVHGDFRYAYERDA
jgi:Cu2+-containing amine oxidase